ncbi:neuropilin-2-like [Clavelina lepadiformis]|uniref:neuropilin-2-like n=1 Tax=Clavelina lepadiformis TaxID=159417 RepID=UPI00404359CF
MTSLIALVLALVFAVVLSHNNHEICLSVPEWGAPGPRGPEGFKGDVGPTGQCQYNLREVVQLREELFRLLEALREDTCLVGVKSGKVRDDEMTASSFYLQIYAAHQGRLDGDGFWHPDVSKYESPGEWLQVDLRGPTTVTGVVTQGSGGSAGCTTC